MNIITLVLVLIFYIFYLQKFLHIFQLEGYKSKSYSHWIISNIQYLFTILFFSLSNIMVILSLMKLNISTIIIQITCSILMLAFYSYDIYLSKKSTYKKPLVYTWRAKRIFITSFVVLIVETFLLYKYLFLPTYIFTYTSLFLFTWAICLVNILIANFILIPVEKLCGLKFINEAKKIIKNRNDLIVIGITGSFGKTSTKFILQTILSEKYKTYATPDSYNTTFGNVKVIREQLNNLHQIYISEMGARNIGDIKEICNIVKPKYGIITSIGNQHLETFKNIDNIVRTKYELIDSLPNDGIAFFPDDNSHCKKLYDDEKRSKILFGSNSSDVYASNITSSSSGSIFTVNSRINNATFNCETKLLGAHNVQNIVGCIAIAQKLGLTNEEIIRGIKKLTPVQHRLELIPNTNGLTVIDDAFNSNPWGAKAALDVISTFSGNKIIITPGMIELGNEQYSANFNFGKQIATTCDITILVGKNITTPIQDGLKEANFDKKNLYIVSSLNEATALLSIVGKLGDVVLFENDLPDNFNE